MRECKADIKDINLSFSLEYIPEEIILCRNMLLKFYEGSMSVEYLNGLTVDEFLIEKKVADRIYEDLEKTINKKIKSKNGK